MSQTLYCITNEQGERTDVVLPTSDYEKLLEDLDDCPPSPDRLDGVFA